MSSTRLSNNTHFLWTPRSSVCCLPFRVLEGFSNSGEGGFGRTCSHYTGVVNRRHRGPRPIAESGPEHAHVTQRLSARVAQNVVAGKRFSVGGRISRLTEYPPSMCSVVRSYGSRSSLSSRA